MPIKPQTSPEIDVTTYRAEGASQQALTPSNTYRSDTTAPPPIFKGLTQGLFTNGAAPMLFEVLIHPEAHSIISRDLGDAALADCARHFLSILFLRSMRDSGRPTSFVKMRSSILKRIYTTRHYPRMLSYLLAHDLIEVADGGSYRAGHYCKRYRLHPAHSSGVSRFPFNNPRLLARAEKTWSLASRITTRKPGRRWLVTSYRAAGVDSAADRAIEQHPFKSTDGRLLCEQLVAEIRTHRLRFKSDGAGARIFYPVTSLPEEIRVFLTLDGAPTVELDAAASQANLLASLYNREATGAEFEEQRRFLRLLRTGLYEEVARWLAPDCTRKTGKKAFFRHIAFGSAFVEEPHPLARRFALEFPLLWERMFAIKRQGNSKLPVLLQKLEAEIVLDRVMPECASSGLKCLTVHDSIICKVTEAPLVEAIFCRHWSERVGFPLVLTRSHRNATPPSSIV